MAMARHIGVIIVVVVAALVAAAIALWVPASTLPGGTGKIGLWGILIFAVVAGVLADMQKRRRQ